MGATMRRIFLTLTASAISALPACADPTGVWRVEDGRAHIRTAICDNELWGVVSWAQSPGNDAHNPDPALRNRPMLGVPIIVGMKKVEPNRWEGSIYNPQNGKTYQGVVTQTKPDELEVEGCVLSGWLCSGQDWTRVKTAPSDAKPASPGVKPAPSDGKPAAPPTVKSAPSGSKPAAPPGRKPPPSGSKPAAPNGDTATADLCARLGIAARRPHEGGLK
jgi:uncharacterized protein (DUF2147 family)